MHCNFICGLSDVIIKTFSQSVSPTRRDETVSWRLVGYGSVTSGHQASYDSVMLCIKPLGSQSLGLLYTSTAKLRRIRAITSMERKQNGGA